MQTETIPYQELSDQEKLNLRLQDLLSRGNSPEAMEMWVDALEASHGDLYPLEEIQDLRELRSPAQLAHRTLSQANPRLDWVLSRFPTLRPYPRKVVDRMIPDLETLLMTLQR